MEFGVGTIAIICRNFYRATPLSIGNVFRAQQERRAVMEFVSCLEDRQKRFESDCRILHRDMQSEKADDESAKKDALRLLGDAQVCWAKMLK